MSLASNSGDVRFHAAQLLLAIADARSASEGSFGLVLGDRLRIVSACELHEQVLQLPFSIRRTSVARHISALRASLGDEKALVVTCGDGYGVGVGRANEKRSTRPVGAPRNSLPGFSPHQDPKTAAEFVK